MLSGNALIQTPRACTLSSGEPCSGCRALVKIDCQVQEPADMVSDMDSRRHEVLIKLNEHHDPFFRHLPIEISGQIFQLCLPETSPPYGLPADYDMEQNRMPALAIFMSLCKNWRVTALSTPALWETLVANHPQDIPDIDRHLTRSGGRLLTIDLDLYQSCWSHLQCRHAITAICRHASRWRTVRLQASQSVMSSLTEDTSALDLALNLSYIDLSIEEADQSLMLHIGSESTPAPSPTAILMKNINLSKSPFDFTKLRFLTLYDTPLNHLEDIIIKSPRLEAMSANICASNPLRPRSSTNHAVKRPPFTHRSLKHLELTIFDTVDQNFFDVITLPSMKTLKCRSLHSAQGTEYQALYNLFLRSNCPLKSLNLSLACDEEQLIRLLRLTPTLRELKIYTIHLSARFFGYMGETTGKATFLPHLGTFRFSDWQDNYRFFDLSLLRPMIFIPDPTELSFGRPLVNIMVDLLAGHIDSTNLYPQETTILGLLDDGIDVSLFLNGLNSKDLIEKHEQLREARNKLRERRTAG